MQRTGRRPAKTAKYFVVAYDYGIKHSILRNLVRAGCRVLIEDSL